MTTPPKDGGPAFPVKYNPCGLTEHEPTLSAEQCQGMSLRDWFAGMALAGHMEDSDSECPFQWTNQTTGETKLLGYGCNPAGPGWTITLTPNEGMAQTMYAKADAMLAERNKP